MTQRNKPESPFPLRMEQDVKSWFRVMAKQNKRSLNGEISFALELYRVNAQKREASHG